MNLHIGKFDIRLNHNPRGSWPWSHFKNHKTDAGRHLVWGKLSLVIEDGEAEVVEVCSECDSVGELKGIGMGDEFLTICQACGTHEPSTHYISQRKAGL